MESTTKEIIHQGNSIISIEILPDYPHPVVIKKPSKLHASRRHIRHFGHHPKIETSANTEVGNLIKLDENQRWSSLQFAQQNNKL